MILNTKKLKVACAWAMLWCYSTIIPFHITSYLFEIKHNSIKSSSGIAESYPILTIVWILFHAIAIAGIWLMVNRIKWLFSENKSKD